MKVCRECGLDQPLTEFYPHRQMADGYLNKCKPCVRRRIRSQRLERGDNIRAYDRARPPRSYTRHTKRHSAAHSAVHKAIKKGLLVRPERCSACDQDGRIEAAHYDYSEPLRVRWLCPRCHRRWDMGGPETRAALEVFV